MFSKYVLQTVETFIASEDQEVGPDHVPVCSSPDIASPAEMYQKAVCVLGVGTGCPYMEVCCGV